MRRLTVTGNDKYINWYSLYANNEQYRIAEDGRWHNNADCNMNVT